MMINQHFNFLKCKDTYDDCNIGLGFTYFYLNEYELAVKYLEPNIDYEDANELYFLGYSYSSLGNYNKAFEFSLKCAELDDADCQNNIGHYYDNGLGTEQNDQLAFIGTQNLMNKIGVHTLPHH